MREMKESPTGEVFHRVIALAQLPWIKAAARNDQYVEHVTTHMVREDIEEGYRINHQPGIDWGDEMMSHLEIKHGLPENKADLVISAMKRRVRTRLSRRGEA